MPPRDAWRTADAIRTTPAVTKTVLSPIGRLRLVARGNSLAAVVWEVERPGRVLLGPLAERPDDPTLTVAASQLADYFAGRRRAFDLALDPVGTPFQQRVWAALRNIPFGQTRSYAALAAEIGAPRAARAVGAANGRNPIAIIIPCHRLVGSSGGLHGFAGGLDAKQLLLTHEAEARRTQP